MTKVKIKLDASLQVRCTFPTFLLSLMRVSGRIETLTHEMGQENLRLSANLTTTLRGHLKREHRDDYLKTCKEKGWKPHSMFNSQASQAATLATSSLERPDRFNEKLSPSSW